MDRLAGVGRASGIIASILLGTTGVAMSGEADRTREELTVYGETVAAERWAEDASPEQVRILGEAEVREIRRAASEIGDWARRYPHERIETGQLSPAILDYFWYEWLSDDAQDRATPEAAVRVLGSAFGHYLTLKLGMQWVEITDRYGTDVCVRGAPGDVTVCPESLVSKRVNSRDADFFGAIFEATRRQLAEPGS
jgi:hypothetical protein